MQLECARYVNTRFAPHPPIGPHTPLPPQIAPTAAANSGGSTGVGPLASPLTDPAPSLSRDESRFDAEEIWPLLGDQEDGPDTSRKVPDIPESSNLPVGQGPRVVDGVGIVELYAALKQGQSVKQWYSQHSRELANIDIRRFITFGVIKGFLYRVHKYACATGQPAPTPRSSSVAPITASTGPSSRATTGNNTPHAASSVGEDAPISARRDASRERTASFHSGSRGAIGLGSAPSGVFEDEEDEIDDRTLSKYLDGTHCFDQTCTELEISERELTARLKRYPGEVLILHR